MFGQITDLPALASYSEALAHHDNITPLRGTKLRPICNTVNGRRKKQYSIERGYVGKIPAVFCRMYKTDVVTFLENGEVVVRNGGWASVGTHDFACAICWRRASFCAKDGRTVVRVGNREVALDSDEPLRLRSHGVCWEVIDPQPNYAYYLRRDVMNKKRKPIKAFQKEILALAKLIDPRQYEPFDTISRPEEPKMRYLIMQDPTHSGYADLVDVILSTSIVEPKWGYGERPLSFVSHKRIKDSISDTIKYAFAAELFERREVTLLPTNDNERFVDVEEEEL